jgi:HlyD family secretion protein
MAGLSLSLTLASGCNRGNEKKGGGQASSASSPGGQPAANAATPIRVLPAKRETVRRTVPVTGSLAALRTVQLAPKVSGRVISVIGREGQTVRRGQVVVLQDTADLRIQLQQARANYDAARARLLQAQTQVRLQEAQSNAGVVDAQQALKAAQTQLSLAKRPQRTQEVNVAENVVAQARANYERAKSDRERYESLVKEGASAQITLDQYVNQEKVAKAALDTAQQQQELAQIGGRSETIRNAESAVRRAEIQLRLARSNRQQNQVRRDEVAAAQATLAQNQAQIAAVQQQIRDASLVAPIDGIISERSTEPGSLAGPSSPVLTIVALDSVYFEAQVPETDVQSVRQGLPVSVRTDAYPNRTFAGRVARILPTANSTSRSVTVRVAIPNNTGLLRPGLFARGEVVAEERQGVVISKDALVSAGTEGGFAVFVAEGNKAVRRPVQVGIQTSQTVEVRSGVKEGDQIVVAGQDALRDGATVRIQSGDDSAPANAAARTTQAASL